MTRKGERASNFMDITGHKYTRLIVIEYHGKTKKGESLWRCKCTCKDETEIIVTTGRLRSDNTKSCGCLQKEKAGEANKTHGISNTSTYSSWANMLTRCYNKNYHSYQHYGGRGIIVCEEWRKSFDNFLKDMGEKPSKSFTLDRVDPFGNYEPSNCRWATKAEQSRNRRLPDNNTSGQAGVCWHKSREVWCASISVEGKKKYLGEFKDINKAIQVRKEAELKYWK